jgi:hypothetical protein
MDVLVLQFLGDGGHRCRGEAGLDGQLRMRLSVLAPQRRKDVGAVLLADELGARLRQHFRCRQFIAAIPLPFLTA